MRIRSTFLALAAVAAVLSTTTVAVSPAAAADSVTVSYADLNLASAAGRQTFERRVAQAARGVCGQPAPQDLKMASLSRACRDSIVASALETVGLDTEQYASLRVSRAAF